MHHTDSERQLEIMAKTAVKNSLRDRYDHDISLRKKQEKKRKELERAKDLLLLKMSESFSPWGRGGGGAPLRDDIGDTISDLTQVYNAKRLPVEPPLSPPSNTMGNALIQSSFDNSKALSKNGARVLQNALTQRLEERYKSIREAFLASDRDRSGFLDAHELKRLCKLYNLDSTQVEGVLEECDIDYNGMISYDEFCQTLVRQDFPPGGAYAELTHSKAASTVLSPHGVSSDPRRRRQARDGGISPTTLSPPFLADLSQGRKSLGPLDDGGNISPGGTTIVWPKKMIQSPTQGGKGASFYVDAPATPERLLQERKRKNLVADLDNQVRERREKRENRQLAELRSTLISQQRKVEQGLDYWDQPIPEGDPRGTAELMALNTMKKLRDIGLSPEGGGNNASFSPRSGHSHHVLLSNNNTTSRHRQYDDQPEKYGSWSDGGGSLRKSLRKPYEDYSPGGGSGPSSGSSKPFMSSLASMNGPSPEEKRKTERRRRRLQEDLAAQVRAQKLKETTNEVMRLRETMKSRQKKIESNLDNWGQKLPDNDPFDVSRHMMSDQDELRRKLNMKTMELKQMEIDVDRAAAAAAIQSEQSPVTTRYHGSPGGAGNYNSPSSPLEQEYNGSRSRHPAAATEYMMEQDEDGVEIISMSNNNTSTSRHFGRGGEVPTFESTPMGVAMSMSSTERSPVSFATMRSDGGGGGGDDEITMAHRDGRRGGRGGDGGKERREARKKQQETRAVSSIERKLQISIRDAMMTESSLRHLFVQFDKAGTGEISADDFQRGFAKLRLNTTKEEEDGLVKRLGGTKNRPINYMKFVKIAIRGTKQQQSKFPHRRKRPGGGISNNKGWKKKSAALAQDAARRGGGARHDKKRDKKRRSPVRGGRRDGGGGGGGGGNDEQQVDPQDIRELMEICRELMREQQLLKKSVRKTNQGLGFPPTPEV